MAALAWKLLVHVTGVLQGGVELAAQTDGPAGEASGPNVLMNWDLQVEPAGSDDGATTTAKPTEETAP